MPGLEIRDLRFQYADMAMEFTLSVPAEQCTALLGASGAGKSTLINLIAGFEAPSAGRILFDGQDITDLPPDQRPVATMFQEHNLFPHLTVYENVGLGVHPGLRLTDADQDHVYSAIERVGLSGMERRRPGELSGGQRRRAALARTLVQNRPLLLLDEPFSALGPALRMDMLDLVNSIRLEHQRTVILVSHLPADARRIAEQTAFLHDGHIIAKGSTDSLLNSPECEQLQAYLGAIETRSSTQYPIDPPRK